MVILGCNGGTDLAYGGGAYVAVALANCLEQQGFEVCLLSVIGIDKQRLAVVHGFELGSKVVVAYIHDADKRPHIPHSMAVRMVGGLVQSVRSFRPSVVIFNDDMPEQILRVARDLDARVLVYVHFSYLVRQRSMRLMYLATEWSRLETLFNAVCLPSLLSPLEEADMVLANSSATKTCTEMWVDRKDIEVICPPIRTSVARSFCKGSIPIALHAARQDRTFLDSMLCEFVSAFDDGSSDLRILVGRNKSRKLAKLSNTTPTVICTGYLPIWLWTRAIEHAAYYLHFKWLEGFGIATAEAIAHGAIPIVFRSPLNGSWTDVIERRDCCSFGSVEEAISLVEGYEREPEKRLEVSTYLKQRLRRFDLGNFAQKFVPLVTGN